MRIIEVNHSGTVKNLLHYKTHEGHVQIDVETILYCHGDGDGPYIQIVIEGDKKYSACESMGSIENLLSGDHFLRCHKSWLVNLKKVGYYSSREKIIVMTNKVRVPISRSKWPETMKKLITFLIEDRKNSVNN
jgi:DNA-binding LytR/AlgR family response regulator